MISKASAMFARIAPRKARVVADLIRGKDAGQALQILEFVRKSAAPVIRKVVESALANARQLHPNTDVDLLFVSKVTVTRDRTDRCAGGGRGLWGARRISPRA